VVQLPTLIDVFGTGAFVANMVFVAAAWQRAGCSAARCGARVW
jgi:hypothetical protein